MRIRWKFLLILLFISLVPMLILRWTGQRSMREIGDDLATRTRDVLIRRASLELKSLVEEHAVILKRERDLIELALQVQASELEKIFSASSAQTAKNASIKMNKSESAGIATQPSPKHFSGMGQMKNRPVWVSYKEQTYRIPSAVNEQVAAGALVKFPTWCPYTNPWNVNIPT